MLVKRFVGGSLESNGYVLYHHSGGACYIIDPGYEPRRFVAFVTEQNMTLLGVLLTHMHRDHTGGAERVAEALSAPIYMHEADAALYRGRVDRTLREGDTLDLEGEILTVRHTPGHTPGSILIVSEKSRMIFSGDTIFDTDLGRTDLAGGSAADMRRSCRDVVNGYGNDFTVYPGHDGSATMKEIRRWNAEFLSMLSDASDKKDGDAQADLRPFPAEEDRP